MGVQPVGELIDGEPLLGERRQRVRDARASLSADQLRLAERDPAEGGGLLMERTMPFEMRRAGLPLERLTPEQQRRFRLVAADFVEDVRGRAAPSSLAGYVVSVSESGGREYFRLSGPLGIFEYEDLGDHIHSVWRSANDYGLPLAPGNRR